MTVSYLDVDDEITNAVSRLRVAEDRDVLLVLPPGSHIATSRINFRLLAREARERHKRLAISSGEAGTRAVAVSAGLPAFASVDEWQEGIRLLRGRPDSSEAVAPPLPSDVDELPSPRLPSGKGNPPAPTRSASAGGQRAPREPRERSERGRSADGGASPGSPEPTERSGIRAAPAPPRTRASGGAGTAAVTAAAAGSAGAGNAGGGRAADLPPSALNASVASDVWPPTAVPGEGRHELPGRDAPRTTGNTRVEGQERPARRRRVLLAALLAVLALFVVIGGTAAYVLLPSATVRVRPPTQRAGPITLNVRADPAATDPDGAAGVVPAETITFPLEATGTFSATGVEVTQSSAQGAVVFENLDPSDENSVPAGAIVATDSDVRFATVAAVTVPASTIEGRTVVPGRAEVGVRAVSPGPAGNVAANAIRNVPATEDPALLEVRNPAATTGGSRTETRFVRDADYTAAVAELETQLDAALADALERRDAAPEGMTLFVETGRRGEATPEPTADAIVGAEAQEFEVTVTAEGTALAVDESTLEPMAADRLTASVPPGWELFDDSVETSHESGQVGEDGSITFAVRAVAEQWRPLDPQALRAEIRGLPVDEARTRLSEHGEVEIETWPGFATAIPTIDSRLELQVLPPSRATP
jgi:hypothetical protein